MGAILLPKWTHPDFTLKDVKPKGQVELDFLNPLTRRLVTAYILNEHAGQQLHDVTGRGNDAQFGATAPIWIRDGLDFSASGASATAASPDLDFTSTDFTIVMRLKRRYTDWADRNLLNRYSFNASGWRVKQDGSAGRIGLHTTQSGTSQSTKIDGIPFDKWFTLHFTRTGATVRGFIDRVEASYNATGIHVDPVTNSGALDFGDSNTDVDYGYCYFYDRVLSDAEIALPYNPYQIVKPVAPLFAFTPVAAEVGGGDFIQSIAGYGGIAGKGGTAGAFGGIAG